MNATPPRRRPVALSAAALLAASLLSSCGPNFNAQTDTPYTPGDGVNNRDGTVDVLNALVVTDGEGGGRLIAGLANSDLENDDTLTDVRPEEEGLTVELLGGDTTIPAGGLLELSQAAQIAVTGERVKAGNFVRVVFTFERAQEAEVNVPVLPHEDTYTDVELPTLSPPATPES